MMFSRSERWVTFDCFGTLVDWNSGLAAIIEPLAGAKWRAVLDAYHRIERRLEMEEPHRLYNDVLATGLTQAANEVGVQLSDAAARSLPDAWATLPVFKDVEPMLAALRDARYRFGVLTNCDEGLFEQTHRSFRRRFDLVMTAERVRHYKPAHAHFECFARETGVEKPNWVHVANSWYHDIAPARELGIPRVWLDRDGTGENPATASAYVRSAAEVFDAVTRLLR